MAEFPVPLDNLIAYVKTLHPDGGPLENVADAFAVSAQLDEQADALIGYFVDQARRSGASWSQIGSAMGVSKQAAQKRFVGGPEAPSFSRFTQRAAGVVAAARRLAADGGVPVSPAHLAAGLLAEPGGIAAWVIGSAGLSAGQFYEAVGAGPVLSAESTGDGGSGKAAGPAGLVIADLSDDSQAALKHAMLAALRLGHNYVGTEHLLLGVLQAGGRAPEELAALGLTQQYAEEQIAARLAGIQARPQHN
jgi:hypothetical protein